MKIGMPQLYEYDCIEDNLKLAKELGLDFIELNLNFGYCRAEMEAKTVADLLKKYDLEATLHFYDEADFGIYDEVVAAYTELLKRYASLGEGYIKQMNMHLIPGPVVTISGVKNYIYEKEYDVYIKRLIKNFKVAEKICNEHGINMVIENTDNIPAFTKRVYHDLYKEGFKFCYDIGHDHLSYDIVWDVLKEIDLPFNEFHVHDAKDRKKCHLALGDGILDVKKFKDLAERNNAYVVLEVKQSSDLVVSAPKFKAL
ncbi:MAG: sugar phosphate isomerase/epimerase [Acholeplasmatales bacterium]|nr:sugar phosphate isomerase/epimerase [Acholeplasmatales bacterium]